MCMRYLGLLLLVWFPGALHARSCAAPTLEKGYFVPEPQTINLDDTKLIYACDKGFKPAVEGWWATITCQNGEWSHEPQCIDEQGCIPPTIPNAKVTESATGWHENGDIIRIKCDGGYEPKDVRQVTTTCTNGTWSSVAGCKRHDEACGEPPQIPHAVIIQEYKGVFAVDAEVTYACEDGYSVVGGGGGGKTKSFFCISGSWDVQLTCRSDNTCGEPPYVHHGRIIEGLERQFDPDAEVTYECDDGYAVDGESVKSIYCISRSWNERPECSRKTSTEQGGPAGPDGGLITTDDSQPAPAGRGTQPGTAQGGSTVERTDGRPTSGGGWVQPGRRTEPETGTGTRPGGGHGGGSSGGTTRPASGGSSATSGSDGRDSKPLITRITHCGAQPVVDNGVVVQDQPMFLKYKCAAFYKLVGSDTVTCYNDGTWSPLPVCEEAFCILKPGEYARGYLRISANEYVAEGEKKITCMHSSFHVTVECRNGQITSISNCCYDYDRSYCY